MIATCSSWDRVLFFPSSPSAYTAFSLAKVGDCALGSSKWVSPSIAGHTSFQPPPHNLQDLGPENLSPFFPQSLSGELTSLMYKIKSYHTVSEVPVCFLSLPLIHQLFFTLMSSIASGLLSTYQVLNRHVWNERWVQPNYRKMSIGCPKYSGGGGIALLFII